MMKIRQILNNNVALVQRGELDVIVLSNGLSFRKKLVILSQPMKLIKFLYRTQMMF